MPNTVIGTETKTIQFDLPDLPTPAVDLGPIMDAIKAIPNDISPVLAAIADLKATLPAMHVPVTVSVDLTPITSKLDSLSATIALLQSGTTPSQPPVTTTPTKAIYARGWTDLTLAPIDDIGTAISIAGRGFKLRLAPGAYKQVFHIPAGLDGWEITSLTGSAADVRLDGQGGLTVEQNNAGIGATRLAFGKGVVHAASPGHIHDLEITGGGGNAAGDHDGQSGLYWECSDGECRATRIMFRSNQNGAFGNTSNKNVHYIFDRCDFVDNSTDGGSHDTYVNGGADSIVDYLYCHAEGSRAGNNFKSRVGTVNVTGGFHGSRNASRWIDAADGATVTVNGGVFVGNDIGQNVFANGEESGNVGPGNTTFAGAMFYLGDRTANFSNRGAFAATDCTVHWTGPNGATINDQGLPLVGLPPRPAPDDTFVAYPAVPAYVSGAR